jgi:hypothetical protein
MADQEFEQLDEVKATGEDSEANDPVTPAGGDPKKKNRPADKSMSVDPKADNIEDTVKTPQGSDPKKAKEPAPGVGMKESVEEMFAGQELSEDFKERATVIFEAAVNAKAIEVAARLEEDFNTKLDEQAEASVNELVEKVDSYLDYVVEKWMEENELAIESGIRTEMAESFMNGLKDLFVEHNVDLDDEAADVVAEMAEELEEREAKIAQVMEETIALRKELAEAHKQDALEEISEGLTETQTEKFEKLVEGVEFDSIEDYKKKVGIIKENYFGGKTLTEEVDEVDPIEEEAVETRHVDPAVASYAEAISRSLRK